MALKPTIYKLRIALSDLERNYYVTLNLTVALHPSETTERMLSRVLAFCLNAQAGLSFTKGLSESEEPDVWLKKDDNTVDLWVDVGEPDPERVKKSVRKANKVKVYSFNTKTDVWWAQAHTKFAKLNAEFTRFDPQKITALTMLLQRTVDWSVTITGQSAYVAGDAGEVDVNWETLQSFQD